MKIVLVDDDHEHRLAPQHAILEATFNSIEVVTIDNVPDAIEYLTSHGDIDLASIDHDLGDRPFRNGLRYRATLTGIDICEALAKLPPRFPVLIHTSSSVEGNIMSEILTAADWNATYVTRGGHDPATWLQVSWLHAVRAGLGPVR